MKSFRILTYLCFVALVGVSCTDEDKFPFQEFDDLEKGAYARKIDGVNGIFDFFAPGSSNVDFAVEFYSEDQGENVDSYSWTVRYIDKSVSPNVISAPADLLTVNKSEFTRSPDGLPSTAINFNLGDALAALGLTTDDINGGDALRFDGTITLNDGRQFDIDNTGTNIISSAPFSGWFRFDQPIICPSSLEGTFDVRTTDAWCGSMDVFTGTTTWEQVAPGLYEITESSLAEADDTYGAYDLCYNPGYSFPQGTLQVQDACNILTPVGADRWGDTYIYNSVTVDGPNLTIVWENTYGEGATTTLTRQDGADWPPLTN